ncbi:Flp pilus assembly complex ATPase component TadA [Herbaspirillum seropedicae]|uniref:Twitching mobility PilT protein n=1 Tax=Herbaspirillum seropedicae (strain SmR1) TaxID=757424 RepID=D8IZZ8_HERSS|nr:ATPase, T2SS/T4P/T4SS family [Herbaspirillum seropedicae]ADJ62335.1 twitching mobility PilT protein [Herbaspirillum seropedicae SmR1]AKN64475.1 twitching motility protein PilT [Herbaspirillum seropedicae]NQE31125.1 twitching motility protein PilT [Herbaspirillum seropedicae]UMU20405.1 Flp pilus assembly complex ATPase component TadA [Herbaspirillum seropedicae]
MSNDLFLARDLQRELLALVNSSQTFSDIHIEQDQPLMLKTPRGWQPVHDMPVVIEQLAPLLSAIDEDWEDKIIDGALDCPYVLGEWRLRCNIYRMARGSKVAVSIRRFPLEPLALERTGLPSYVKTVLEATKGIILVTGPTGAGKTTTIASMLDYINASRRGHIITIEEPIEYELQRKQSMISQKEVPTDTESFSSGLREALRQKPDVLMVGEIRDFDTADTVLHAGESGHLVLATLHTSSAVRAITKLLGFFPQEQRAQRAATLAESLVGVIFQSLLPSEDGEHHVMASEMVFNNNQQIAAFISDPAKLHLIGDFMKRKEDNMSRSLNEVLLQLVHKKSVSARDALRVAYNRLELHEMLNSAKR